jgi:hypothetical protein
MPNHFQTKTINRTDSGISSPGAANSAPTAEIPHKFWADFFASLKRTRHLIHVCVLQPDGTMKDIANDVPLRRVLLEQQNEGCSSLIVLETGEDQEKLGHHTIIEPFRLWLENGDGERFGRLQIRAESGTTLVDFHPLITYERHTG